MNPKTKTTLFTFLRKDKLNSDFYGMDALSLGSESTLEEPPTLQDSLLNFGSSLASDDEATFANDDEDGEVEETKTEARLQTERVVRRIEHIMPRSTSSAKAVNPAGGTELHGSMGGGNMFGGNPTKNKVMRRNSFDPKEIGAHILSSSSHSNRHCPEERKGQGGRRRLFRRTNSYALGETKMRSLSSSDDSQRQKVLQTDETKISRLSSSDHFQSRRAENRKSLQRSMSSRSHSSRQQNESSDDKNRSSTKLQHTASDKTQLKMRSLSSSDHVQKIRKPLQRSMSSSFHSRQQQREFSESNNFSSPKVAENGSSDDQEDDEMLRLLEEIDQKLMKYNEKPIIDDNGPTSLEITQVECCGLHKSFLQINLKS